MKNRKKEKIIFLDIDGCMLALDEHYFDKDTDGLEGCWKKEAIELVRYFCTHYGYKIVITSDWKEQPEMLQKYLEKYNLFQYLHAHWRTDTIQDNRENQIRRWCLSKYVSNFIIIEDAYVFDSNVLEEHHVKPNCLVGLRYTQYVLMEQIEKVSCF